MDDRAKVQGRLARMLVPDVLVNGLRLFWVTLVVWGEIGLFFLSLSDCRWPDRAFRSISKAAPTHVLLIADPQLLPPLSGRTWTQVFRDIYLHKSWSAVRHLRPNMVLFLGDMLAAGGSFRDDEGYIAYVKKFKDTFALDPAVEVHYLPGNSDVGLGASNSFTKRVRDRYQAYFGSVNQHHSVANHSLVLLDAPGLVDEDYLRAGRGVSFEDWSPVKDGPIEFVKTLTSEARTDPVILFSHIPLHRAESRKCGPLREKGTIRRGVGHGWQSTLGKQTSRFLLDSLYPVIVFSADDRDYCDVPHILHDNASTSIHEITVKSFSLTRHITRPGLQLLSLLPASEETISKANSTTPRHAHRPCLLPSRNSALTSLYTPFFILSMILLLISHYRRKRRTQPKPHSPTLRHSPTPTIASPIPPSPYSSSSTYSYAYAQSNKPPHSPGAPLLRTPSQTQTAYFDLPVNNRSVIGAGGLRTPRTPRTPWTPWTPQSPGMSIGPDDDVEAEGGDTERAELAPSLRGARSPRPSAWVVGARRDAGEDDEGDEGEYVYVGGRKAEVVKVGEITRPPGRGAKEGRARRRRCVWEYVFSLGGRRRRVVVGVPAWAQDAVVFAVEVLRLDRLVARVTGEDVGRKVRTRREARGVWAALWRDAVRVGWPAGAVWAVICWWYS